MDTLMRISTSQISELLEYASKYPYQASDNQLQSQKIEEICLKLFQLDYVCTVISNANGELCNNYPSKIVMLEYERVQSRCGSILREDQMYGSVYDKNEIREQIGRARVARCRTRFPLPVILYNGKHICRSSTLSGGPEIYGRSGLEMIFSGGVNEIADDEIDELDENYPRTASDWQLFDRVRNQDIKLLKVLGIKTICDLMVENKKVKFGVNVTSSEKVDKANRYADFNIISLPYPGCEFFRVYKACQYDAEGLIFDWTQSHIDTNIVVPVDPVIAQLGIDWSNYKSWDLIQLTQNYLRLVLACINENSSGILIHCISGWDRTPLFISLVRLSLWADGKIHQSLGANEILFLTLAYDWFLCGHNLKDRVHKGEEILYFCFYFLKHILSDDFSVDKRWIRRHQNNNKGDGIVDDYFDAEQLPICGSNTSLNSNCSSLSYRSQENPPTLFTNAENDPLEDKNHQKFGASLTSLVDLAANTSIHTSRTSTSPVAVPVKVRKRSDSGSSAFSSGSWQIITASGSVRGSGTWHTSSSDASSHSRLSQTSLCDINESEASLESSTATVTSESRKERLTAIRNTFIPQYYKIIKGDASRVTSFIDQFAEKVGIRSSGNKPI